MPEENYRLKAVLMDDVQMMRTLTRLSHEIIEKNGGVDGVVFVGIIRRGVPLAQLLADNIEKIEGVKISVGSIDISFYRDDLTTIDSHPIINGTDIPFDISGKKVILVDDVIYTGRTVRAAIDGLFEQGRPDKIELAVMIDRGLRDLPIRPDFVGKNIPTSHREVIKVKVDCFDSENSVSIYTKD